VTAPPILLPCGATAMKIYSIYKVTNKVNGKSYIGFTGKTLERRVYEHIYRSKNTDRNEYFMNAIRKYGCESFEWEILCQSFDGNYLLETMEPYFIKYYDTHKNGYNSTLGGEGMIGLIHSEDTKKKISNANKGRPSHFKGVRFKDDPNWISPLKGKIKTLSHRQNLSKSLMGHKNTPEVIEKQRKAMTGRKQTPEHIAKRMKAHIGKKRNEKACENIKKGRWG
jgi:group I intron endonuclease